MLEKFKSSDIGVIGIVIGCLVVMLICMIGFIIVGDYIRSGMILFMFCALYFLLKDTIKRIIKLKK